MGNTFNPWRTLRDLRSVKLVYDTSLPGEWLGACSTSRRRIWINATRVRTQAERRCVLTHELVHLHHNHEGHQPPAVERRVCAETAGLLITHTDLMSALAWTDDLYELADTLWVTPAVVRDRLDVMKDQGVFGVRLSHQ